jgi:hypothetical protein
VPASKELSRKYKREAFMKWHNHEGSAEEYGAANGLLKEDGFHDDDDDASVSDESVNSTQRGQIADHGGKEYEGWKPRYRYAMSFECPCGSKRNETSYRNCRDFSFSFPIKAITIRIQNKQRVSLVIAFQSIKQEREILFDTIEDAALFVKEVEKQKRLESERQQGRLKAALGDIKLPKFEKITFLFEIVSGYDLPIGDFTSSDPFVIAMLGHQEVHRTQHLEKT